MRLVGGGIKRLLLPLLWLPPPPFPVVLNGFGIVTVARAYCIESGNGMELGERGGEGESFCKGLTDNVLNPRRAAFVTVFLMAAEKLQQHSSHSIRGVGALEVLSL